MIKSDINKNLSALNIEKFVWSNIQNEMKNKLGFEVYEVG